MFKRVLEKDQKLINQTPPPQCTRCTTKKKEMFRRFKCMYKLIQRPAFITMCTRTYRPELWLHVRPHEGGIRQFLTGAFFPLCWLGTQFAGVVCVMCVDFFGFFHTLLHPLHHQVEQSDHSFVYSCTRRRTRLKVRDAGGERRSNKWHSMGFEQNLE